MPGTRRSLINVARPVTFSRASRRCGEVPTVERRGEDGSMTLCLQRSVVVRLCQAVGRYHDRLENAFIPRTAAQIAPHIVFDLRLGGRWIFLQQGLRRQDHPRGTEAALQPTVLDEGFLNGMQG